MLVKIWHWLSFIFETMKIFIDICTSFLSIHSETVEANRNPDSLRRERDAASDVDAMGTPLRDCAWSTCVITHWLDVLPWRMTSNPGSYKDDQTNITSFWLEEGIVITETLLFEGTPRCIRCWYYGKANTHFVVLTSACPWIMNH